MKTKNKVKNISLIEGPIWKSILKFTFPIMLGMFFQQLYNTVDAIIVGRFVGKEAFAAVGGGTAFYINLLVGFCGGLSSGATIIISQFFGAKRKKELSDAIHTSVILAVVLGIIVTVSGFFLSDFAMTLLNTPSDIFKNAVIYLRVFFLGVIPMFLYNMGAGILRSVGDSRTPFFVLVVACFVNIFLDCFFVIKLNLGVMGVALATDISQIVSMIFIFIVLCKSKECYGIKFSKLKASPSLLKKMVKLGVPAGLYSTMYTLSNLIMMTFVNSFGTSTIAGWTAWGKLDSLFWMTVSSVGMALSTFTGQNFGAKQFKRIKKGVWQTLGIMYFFTFILVVVFRTFGKIVYGWFIPGETEVINIGMQIVMFLTPAFFLYVPNEIFSNVVGGAGKTYVSMTITFFGICCARLVWLFAFCRGTTDFIKVISCYPISWLISGIMFFTYYKIGKWIPQEYRK